MCIYINIYVHMDVASVSPRQLWFSVGSALVLLSGSVLVQFWFRELKLIFPIVQFRLVQLWFSFVWYDCLRLSFVSVRPHVFFLWPELPWFSFVFIIHSFVFSVHINFTVCTETSLLHPVKPTRTQVLLSSWFFWV